MTSFLHTAGIGKIESAVWSSLQNRRQFFFLAFFQVSEGLAARGERRALVTRLSLPEKKQKVINNLKKKSKAVFTVREVGQYFETRGLSSSGYV